MSKVYDFTAANLVRFRVKVIFQGEKYGLNGCLTHTEAEPLVEFYDLRHMHTKDGQFVSRYSLLTVLGIADNGLMLYGGVPTWTVDYKSITYVKAFLLGATQ